MGSFLVNVSFEKVGQENKEWNMFSKHINVNISLLMMFTRAEKIMFDVLVKIYQNITLTIYLNHLLNKNQTPTLSEKI